MDREDVDMYGCFIKGLSRRKACDSFPPPLVNVPSAFVEGATLGMPGDSCEVLCTALWGKAPALTRLGNEVVVGGEVAELGHTFLKTPRRVV